MNDNSKTLTYVGVAALLLGLGIWAGLPSKDAGIAEDKGAEFFPAFKDPLKVAGAEVIDFDAVSNVKHDLKVARVDDVWEINPDKQGYPGVSPERLGEVVKAVSGLKKLDVVTDEAAKHRTFGVVDPSNEAQLKEGTEGVGKRVTLFDADRKALVDLIVGKKDDKNSKLYYVRQPAHDRVYAAELDTAPLSTRFSDWVQPDLLDIGKNENEKRFADLELRKVDIYDYAIDLKLMRQQGFGPGGPVFATKDLVQRAKLDAAKDDSDIWQIKNFETYDKATKTFTEKKLTAEEELDSAKFDDLRRALAGLKIVDATRKPKVLAEDLMKEKSFLYDPTSVALADDETVASLRGSGFLIGPRLQSGELALVSEEGELKVGFENGVEYYLRFGGLIRNERSGGGDDVKAGDAKAGEDKPAEANAGEGAAEGASTAPNRYLFVTASFNPNLIPKPPLQTLPPEAGSAAPAATPAASAVPAPTPSATPNAAPAASPTGSAAPAAVATPTATAAPTAKPAPTASATPTAPKPSATPSATPKPAEGGASEAGSCELPSDPCQADPAKPEPAKADVSKPSPTPSAVPSATPSATPIATKPAPSATPSATPAAAPAATAAATAAPSKTDAPAAEPKAGTETKPGLMDTIMNKIMPAAELPKPAPAPKPLTPEQRKAAELENQRLTAKYETDMKKGREKAKELNERFAQWYYVIDDATFRSLDINPTTLAKKKGAEPAAGPNPMGGPMGGQNIPPDLMRQLQMQQMQQRMQEIQSQQQK